MSADQLFYLEKDGLFWEMKCIKDNTSTRAGKVGKPGRKFAEKRHESESKAKQFAVRQVNAKIIEGFKDPELVVPRAQMVKSRSSIRIKNVTAMPKRKNSSDIKTQDKTRSVSQLKRHDTVQVNESKSDKLKCLWRKPPKKQSTIRRKANHDSTLERQPSLTKQSTILIQKPPKKQKTRMGKLLQCKSTLTSKQCAMRKKNTYLTQGPSYLPRLERRPTSWKYNQLTGPELSIPILRLEVDSDSD